MEQYVYGMLITTENVKEKFIEFYSGLADYKNLTERQKHRFLMLLEKFDTAIKGTPKQRWYIIQAIYYSFLAGIKEQDA